MSAVLYSACGDITKVDIKDNTLIAFTMDKGVYTIINNNINKAKEMLKKLCDYDFECCFEEQIDKELIKAKQILGEMLIIK